MTARTKLIPIRMSDEEVRTLKAAAARAGLGLGPWLRSLGMREAAKVKPPKPPK